MIGKQLGGRYEILERVGGGGMAIVYKSLDILLHRHVAVKVLRQQYVHDEEFIQRFRREAQAAASLSHSNVVSIYDVGQEEDIHYIVMEYIEGTTLNDLIKEKAPLPVEEAVHFASQICDALDHAHHNQIIHRDIKPHNILIGRNGRAKVTDFGIARAITSSTITQTGSVVGSVHYFSPEHAKGTATGEQSDLYSLGIVMYQMLTGRLPFLGESPISVALKHLQEEVEEPRKVNPMIPQSVENIILKAMRKNPSERYRSAKQMLNDLDSCLLPHRRNEAKIDFLDDDELDEEKTLIIPAIRPDQYGAPVIDDEDDEPMAHADNLPTKQKRWTKPVAWIVVLLLILGVMWYMVGVVKAKFVVHEVDVPMVQYKPVAEAEQLLAAAGLRAKIERQPSKDVPKDVVISQGHPNMKMTINGEETLVVSSGVEKKQMPPVVGTKFAEAKAALAALGIPEDRIIPDYDFVDEPKDTVISQEPALNEEIDPSTVTVKLGVSNGRETLKMPDLVGLTEAAARSRIAMNDLKLAPDGITTETSYKQPKGKVIKQFPYQYNDEVARGESIKLIISSGLPPEAGEMTVPVTVKPAEDGKETAAKIILSDAAYDSYDYKTLKVTKPTTVDVKLVVSPNKSAVIQIKQANVVADMITVTYDDYTAHKDGKPFNPVPASVGGTPAPNAPATPQSETDPASTQTSGAPNGNPDAGAANQTGGGSAPGTGAPAAPNGSPAPSNGQPENPSTGGTN
ncbi:Stk1 family PASTA domain-containing Ser/Thr kinase [Paenibacillus xerothermodurans]|uniref:Serine/threonine-protein kinase PrkC n=1 Tax=Paenibacillus xerothermodurans TaxID=1977292 RepID=A0A2W1NFR2_PAEXE|nr:Stk1 family PASTA domain-containing Ser/Thr kinase [Paenibacillus xerothermodurans]PZE22520.1 Stk1 family PASTA domain-containing Ser/Thr kinase [Paenibacillus xerothermodurans]